jgi:hypothetical protein
MMLSADVGAGVQGRNDGTVRSWRCDLTDACTWALLGRQDPWRAT